MMTIYGTSVDKLGLVRKSKHILRDCLVVVRLAMETGDIAEFMVIVETRWLRMLYMGILVISSMPSCNSVQLGC